MKKIAIILALSCVGCAGILKYSEVHQKATEKISQVDSVVTRALDAYTKADRQRIKDCTGFASKAEFVACKGKFTTELRDQVANALEKYTKAHSAYTDVASECAPVESAGGKAECIIKMQDKFLEIIGTAKDFAKKSGSGGFLKELRMIENAE